MVKTFSKAIAVVALATAGFANATPVTSLSGSTTYAFQDLDYFGNGPQTVASGITWTSEYQYSVYGYDNGYGFGNNGMWISGLSMIGTNETNATMSITFDSGVSGVGAFLNYVPYYVPSSISIYGASNNLLEAYSLNFLVSGNNAGEFHGFSRSTADIFRIDFTGSYIGA